METILSRTYTAGADYSSTGQNRFVYFSAEDTITLADGTHPAVGVLLDNPESGALGSVLHIGVARVSMSATCSAGDKIGATTNGQGVAVTADDTEYFGIALQDCSNANEEIRVLIGAVGGFVSGSGDD